MTTTESAARTQSAPVVPKLPRVLYGGDYNPEQWPEAVWAEDARLMREAGVNLVSLGIFAWARLEPRPGEYDFGWLDRVVNLLHAHGISVNLATATASPPPWFSHAHPESLPVTDAGVRLSIGARQHYCPSSPAYREAARALVTRLAERYRDHPALALWHVNNEYGCHVSECFCNESARAFRSWLRDRYVTLEALNAAWGTAFWSQEYGDWDEIDPPRVAPTFRNPSQQLDWRRFSSDALLALFEMEREVLKRVTPDVPVTTNFMCFFKPLDYWKWAERQDVISNDAYPQPSEPSAAVEMAMGADLMRSLGGGRPWVLMEQVSTQVQWRERNPLKRPGVMRLWSHQAVARGADGVMFFQWRQSRAGAEKWHGAMLPHAGTNTRTFQEISGLGAELARLTPVLGSRVKADVAILLDWESWWALELDARPSKALTLLDQVRDAYTPLWERNVAVDFARPGQNLSGYRLVLAPNLYLMREGVGPQLEAYVSSGGTLVVSFFSGLVDEHDQVLPGAYPAALRRVLGLRVEEFDPYPEGHSNRVLTPGGEAFTSTLWADVIVPEGAEVLGTFGADFYAARPAVTRHTFGRGVSYYLGTRLDTAGMHWVLGQALERAGVRPPLDVPGGVEVVRREHDHATFLFLLNHTDRGVQVSLTTPVTDVLTGEERSADLSLGPRGVAVLQQVRVG